MSIVGRYHTKSVAKVLLSLNRYVALFEVERTLNLLILKENTVSLCKLRKSIFFLFSYTANSAFTLGSYCVLVSEMVVFVCLVLEDKIVEWSLVTRLRRAISDV